MYHVPIITPPPTKRRTKRQCEPKKNTIKSTTMNPIRNWRQKILSSLYNKRPALLDTGGVYSYQMTNSGKQQRCCFFCFLSVNTKKTNKKSTKQHNEGSRKEPTGPGGTLDGLLRQFLGLFARYRTRGMQCRGAFQRGCKQGLGIKKNGRNKGRINMPTGPLAPSRGHF